MMAELKFRSPRVHAICMIIGGAAIAIFVTGTVVGGDEQKPSPEERFELLAMKYDSARKKLFADAENVKDADERNKLFLERDPANTMFRDFLQLEEQCRGSNVGLSALYHLVSVALGGYGGNPAIPATQGAQTALATLTGHYWDHPDLDVIFPWLKGGNCGEEQKALLRRAITSSHRHIRGTATLTLAKILQSEAEVPAMLKANLELVRDEPEGFAGQIKAWSNLLETWANIDPQISRQEALQLLDRSSTEFGDVLESPRAGYGPIVLKVEHLPEDSLTKLERRTLKTIAESIRIELTTLGIGNQSPEIAGPDALGNDLSLKEQRGKVVVLMFSFKGCGPCEAMYPDNRKLIETYRGRPFQFVGVMGDEQLVTVKESIDNKTITWPVWWDGTRGPIVTRWNVSSWPTMYVLDHQGVIRYRHVRGEILSRAVAKLVAAAEQAAER